MSLVHRVRYIKMHKVLQRQDNKAVTFIQYQIQHLQHLINHPTVTCIIQPYNQSEFSMQQPEGYPISPIQSLSLHLPRGQTA